MMEAAYTVGGHSFSAAAIEYEILKMKLPHHGPQIVLLLAVEKFKVSEGQRKFAIDSHEPLVTFTLSCGMYSLPSIRIYTAKHVREELEDPQHDYIRAAVAVSNKGRLLVAKNASLLRQKFCGWCKFGCVDIPLSSSFSSCLCRAMHVPEAPELPRLLQSCRTFLRFPFPLYIPARYGPLPHQSSL